MLDDIEDSRSMRLLLLICSVVFLSCADGDGLVVSQSEPPYVTGLRLTKSNTEQLGVWGNPLFPNDEIVRGEDPKDSNVIKPRDPATGVTFYNPFPNPSNGAVKLNVALPERASVRIWIARLELQGTQGLNATRSGAWTAESQPVVVDPGFTNYFEAGIYQISWNPVGGDGRRLPPGFYRVYVQMNSRLMWKDVLLYDDASQLPESLRSFVSQP